jgi:ABC-type amino acid transport system permease subunit
MDFSFDQLDAAHAFGMGPFMSFRHIIFPQLWRVCLPGLVNEMTLLIKSSPAIAVIGVVDLTRAASRIGADTYEPLPPMLAATGLYTLLILVFVVLQRVTERRFGQVGQAQHG